MAKKILITGGAGYIGSHTALELSLIHIFRDLSLELLQSLYVFFQNMELQLQFLVVLHQVRSSVRSTDSSMYTVRSNHSLLQFVPCSYSVDLSNI